MIRPLYLFLFGVCTLTTPQLFAQATIRSVVNAASLAPAGAPNAPITPGAQFTVLGSGLGPDDPQQVSAFPYPTTDGLGGVTVQATIGGSSTDCILISVSATAVTAVLPSSAGAGTGTVSLTYQGSTVTSPITVVAANAGVFTTAATGSGLATASVLNDDGTTTVVSPSAPAHPGQKVVLLATGLGAVSGDEAAAAITAELDVDVSVMVGNVKANVLSKGRAGLAPGLDQITIETPSGFNSCAVPVVVRTGAITSNFTYLSIASDANCPDAAFTTDDLQRIQQQGEYRSGSISLSRSSVSVQGFDLTTESASGSFFDVKVNTIATGQFQIIGNATPGSCFVILTVPSTNTSSVDFRVLDAGPSLVLTGPKGDRQMVKQNGSYTVSFGTPGLPIPGLPPPQTYLDPGDYVVTGPGGADIGAFTANLTIGPALNWTNRATVGNAGNDTIDRSQDATVTWTGGRPSDIVTIAGSSAVTATRLSASFTCLENVSAGKFTIPSWVLSAIPPAAQGSLYVGTSNGAPFSASGLDSGTIQAGSLSLRTIAYK